MHFASDNWAGASPRVGDALLRACQGVAPAYGNDDATAALTARMAALFEREVAVFLTPTGTATNALALATLCPPNGAVLAHGDAHIIADEYGAVEFFGLGARLVGIPGPAGKIDAAGVAAAVAALPLAGSRQPKPAALSLTQATESGTVYGAAEVTALSASARQHGMRVHMDGARFANAVATLGCTPAEITWKAGVDALSFGGTKNGALMAEAVVFFDKELAESLAWRRQRGGHVVSKARLISAQFLALLDDDHWLELARHANAMAARLATGLVEAGHRLAWPTQANEVFAILRQASVTRARAEGASFYEWPSSGLPVTERPKSGEVMVRLVTSFATTPAEVERFIAAAA